MCYIIIGEPHLVESTAVFIIIVAYIIHLRIIIREYSTMTKNITQFAVAVENFSSQYGTQGTSSYTASNLAGDLRVYDNYGDFVEAFVLVGFLGSVPPTFYAHVFIPILFSVRTVSGGEDVRRLLAD